MNETEQEKVLDQEEEEKKPSPAERFHRSVFEWAETIVLAIALVAVMFTFAVRIITVDGPSMQPTYYNGDRVLVSGFSKHFKQGDIVIIVNTLKDPIIKRVIATGGQTVDFDPELREVIVDGVPVYGDRFGVENGITMLPDSSLLVNFPTTVPDNCVFVLGDNRTNSTDSRFADVGMVDQRNVLGKVIFNLYPFSQVGLVK